MNKFIQYHLVNWPESWNYPSIFFLDWVPDGGSVEKGAPPIKDVPVSIGCGLPALSLNSFKDIPTSSRFLLKPYLPGFEAFFSSISVLPAFPNDVSRANLTWKEGVCCQGLMPLSCNLNDLSCVIFPNLVKSELLHMLDDWANVLGLECVNHLEKVVSRRQSLATFYIWKVNCDFGVREHILDQTLHAEFIIERDLNGFEFGPPK